MSSGDSEPVPIKRDRTEIEGDLKEVEVEFSALQEKGSQIMQSMGDENGKFGDLSVKLGDMVFENRDEEMAKLRDTLDDGEKSFYDGAVPLLTAARALKARQVVLQQEYKPIVESDLKEVISELNTGLDFGAVLKYHDEQNELHLQSSSDLLVNTLLETGYLRKCTETMLKSPGALEFDELSYMLNTLSAYKSEWSKKGFLKEVPQESRPKDQLLEKDTAKRMDLLERFREVAQQLEEYKRLSHIYKPTLKFVGNFDYYMDEVLRSMDLEGRAGEYFKSVGVDIDTLGVDPRYVDAAEAYLQKRIDTYRDNGFLPRGKSEAAQKSRELDIGNILLEGMDTPESGNILITKEQFRSRVLEPLPRGFLIGLQSVSFTARPEDLDQNDPLVETVGVCIPHFNEAREFTHSTIEIYMPNEAKAGSTPDSNLVQTHERVTTGWHEMAHNAHANLTFDEMQGWEKVMDSDPTTISWYVKYTTREKETDPTRRKREDFSESFAMYMDDPALLQTLSPERFEYMTTLFLSRTPEDQVPDFVAAIMTKMLISRANWIENGYDRDMIKTIYLPK